MPSDLQKQERGTYYIPNNPQGAQAQHSAIPADRTKGVRTYLYLNGERVAVNNLYNTNHGQYYYGSDILGSVKFVTGQGGQELKRIEYDVFGGIYKGNSPYGLETGYTGKPYDSVTGLSDYGFRDYSPAYARFITEDPIRDGENWFAYVGNNPVNWIDPWGLSTSDGKGNHQKLPEQKPNLLKEFFDIFSVDVKFGLGLDISFISNIGINLFSQGANFSTKNGYEEKISSSISSGVVGYEINAPDLTEYQAGIKILQEQGKSTLNVGPVQISEDSVDTVFSFGGQLLVGVYLNISGNEILDFIEKAFRD